MELTDLRETADLARLNLSEEELKKVFPAFEEMLSFFAVMKTAETDGTFAGRSQAADSMAASAKIVSSVHLRPDTVNSPPEEDLCELMLSQSPERDGRFIVIPNVL